MAVPSSAEAAFWQPSARRARVICSEVPVAGSIIRLVVHHYALREQFIVLGSFFSNFLQFGCLGLLTGRNSRSLRSGSLGSCFFALLCSLDSKIDRAIQNAPAVILKAAGARSVRAGRSLVNVAAAAAATILVQYL